MSLRKTILIVFLEVVAGLFLIEGTARVFIYPHHLKPTEVTIPHPVLNHALNPNVSTISRLRGEPYKVFANKEGWVEKYDVDLKKSPGTYRIFFIGDSNVEGVVNDEQKMVTVVEGLLNKHFQGSGINFEVINAGCRSYSTVLYYLLVKTVLLKYSPDLVVINVDMTDIPDDYFYRPLTRFDANGDPEAVLPVNTRIKDEYFLTPFGRAKLSLVDKIDLKLSEWSAFYRWMSLHIIKQPNPSLHYMDPSANWLSLEWDDKIRENVDFSMHMIELTMKLLKDHGVKCYVTGVPHHLQYTGKYSLKPFRVLSETVYANGGFYMDSFTALEKYVKDTKRDEYYWRGDPGHFNAKGNILWAATHFEFLTYPPNRLLPQKVLVKPR